MKGMNRKMCFTVLQMRDLLLNITLTENFVMILLLKKKNIEEKKVEKCHVRSSRTLKRGLHEYGLRRRNEVHSEHEVRELIKREIEGPSSLLGSCDVVQAKNKLQYCCPSTHSHCLRELAPQASTLRKARKLPCRSYSLPGRNAGSCWRIRQTEIFRLNYTWLRGWIFQENIVALSM